MIIPNNEFMIKRKRLRMQMLQLFSLLLCTFFVGAMEQKNNFSRKHTLETEGNNFAPKKKLLKKFDAEKAKKKTEKAKKKAKKIIYNYTKTKPHICTYKNCPQSFTTSDELRDHVKKLHRITCYMCQKKLTSAYLKSHLLNKHNLHIPETGDGVSCSGTPLKIVGFDSVTKKFIWG